MAHTHTQKKKWRRTARKISPKKKKEDKGSTAKLFGAANNYVTINLACVNSTFT